MGMTKLLRGSVRKLRAEARGNSLKVETTRRAAAFRCGSPRTGRCRILAESKALKVTLPLARISGSPGVRRVVANTKRVTAAERRRRLREGEKP
jgi:hypothetical protein